ncbi:MAG: hypothetical protein DI529_11530 [Chryseobacterium sp.]|nr:MAG: hypothetical protein DI529_11530 [Chryseobacterium sp.]
MKKYFYLFILSISLISCYTYKVSTDNDDTKPSKNEPRSKGEQGVKSNEQFAVRSFADNQANIASVASKGPRNLKPEKDKKPNPTTVQEKLEINKYFKIEVDGRSYKIQVDKWESDTLVAHVIHKPKKILKFHKNQIDQSTIAERRFSQPTADIITVLVYAGIGVGIWSLVR